MGTSNNIGLRKCKTQFAFVINPDTKLEKNCLEEIIKSSMLINDFSIISPISNDANYLNYLGEEKNFSINENIISVNHVDGFSMLFNREKFKSQDYFDENFFLFLENDDLCKRTKILGNKIYVIKNAFIDHKGFSSVAKIDKDKLEYLRNWHWMWSKFYFNKKHYGYFQALILILPRFFSSILKILIFTVLLNKKKRKIYQFRFSGIFNSMAGKTSWYRIKD
jgi:GT2 family glycosyltransferase